MAIYAVKANSVSIHPNLNIANLRLAMNWCRKYANDFGIKEMAIGLVAQPNVIIWKYKVSS